MKTTMKTLRADDAQHHLASLIEQTAEFHEPIVISGRKHDAVLVSAEDWSAIQETLFLLSVPGMRESIRVGMETPLSACDWEPNW